MFRLVTREGKESSVIGNVLWNSYQIFDSLLCYLPGSSFLVVVGGVGIETNL